MAGGRFALIRTEVIKQGSTGQHLNDVIRVAQEKTIRAVAEKVRELGYKGIAFDIDQMAKEL